MPDPEALARIEIDLLLTEAGWLVVDRDQANIFAGRGIAIREVLIPGAGEADYLLMFGLAQPSMSPLPMLSESLQWGERT